VNFIDPSGLFGFVGGFSFQGSTLGGAGQTGGFAYLGETQCGAGAGVGTSASATVASVGASVGRGFSGGFYANTIESFLNSNSFDLNSPIGGISLYFGSNGSFEGITFAGPSTGLSVGYTPSSNSVSTTTGVNFIKNAR
jgi:hypothetical protein